MNIVTCELTGPALDWAVAKCDGQQLSRYTQYSTDWASGGPIIERNGIRLHRGIDGHWWAATEADPSRPVAGATPLVAAMRCYVEATLGDSVNIPSELM